MYKINYKCLLILISNLIINEITAKEIKVHFNRNNAARSENIEKYNHNKYSNNDNYDRAETLTETSKPSSTSSSASSDLQSITWDCAYNSSCVQSVAKNIIKNYENGKNIDFELFNIEKLPKLKKSNSDNNLNKADDGDVNANEGRSTSSISEFLNENAVRIPFGSMVLNVQRSDDDSDLMEISLQGKSALNDTAEEKGIGRRHKVIRRKNKKHLQIILPMYLAANTFGWTLLAVKAVTILAIKAILVSKLAFLAASSIVVKNFMDNSHKLMYPQHFPPSLTSYNMMDYNLQAAQVIPDALEEQYHAAQLAYGQQPQQAQIVAQPQHLAQPQHFAPQPQQIIGHHQPQQNLSPAGSNHIVYAIQANGNPTLGGGSNVKRKDQWTGVRRPPLVNALPTNIGAKSK